MGCNVSRLDSQDPNFLTRLRPLFLQRFGEIKTRRNLGGPLKDSTPSKKELLSNVDDENANSRRLFLSPDPSKPKAGGKKEAPKNNDYRHNKKENVAKDGGLTGLVEIKTKVDEARVEDDHFTDAVDELGDDDDDDRNKRMIGYHGDESFPGSPSFRIYFKDNEVNNLDVVVGKKDDVKETFSQDGGDVTSKESSAKEKLERSKKKRSFRYVLPKNLLNVKSCYTPSQHSSHDNSHRLPAGKKTT